MISNRRLGNSLKKRILIEDEGKTKGKQVIQ